MQRTTAAPAAGRALASLALRVARALARGSLAPRAAVLCAGGTVDAALARALLPLHDEPRSPTDGRRATDLNLDRALGDVERQLILDALAATHNDKPAAAKLLGIGERTLWTKLKKHAI